MLLCRLQGLNMNKAPIPRVDVTISPSFKGEVTPAWLRKIAKCALANALSNTACQMGLVIGDDAMLKELNRMYRGLDEVTDVLSFSTGHEGHWEGDEEPPPPSPDISGFFLMPEEPQHLGEIIISLPQAERQALDAQHPRDRELAHLIVHGTLHLLGYDHIEDAEAAAMRSREQEIMTAFFGPDAP